MATGNFRWQSMKGMPTKRVFCTPIVYEDCLYVVGGCNQSGEPLDSFEVFDFGDREPKWKKLPAMPTKRAGAGVAALNGKIVVLGGVSQAQNPLDAVEVYDIKGKVWKTGDDMKLKEPLLGMSVLVRDGKILILGGMGKDTNPHDYFFELNIEGEFKYKELPVMPTARYATSAFLIGSDLYVIGGRHGKLPTAAFEVFHFETNKWENLKDIPSKRVFPIYVTDNSNIFSLGGLKQPATEGFSDACEVFNIEKKEWSSGPPMPTKRADLAAGVVGGKVICAGGLGVDGRPLNVVESYDPVGRNWTSVSDVPSTHCSCAYIMYKDRLHIIGGLSIKGPSSCMEALGCSQTSSS